MLGKLREAILSFDKVAILADPADAMNLLAEISTVMKPDVVSVPFEGDVGRAEDALKNSDLRVPVILHRELARIIARTPVAAVVFGAEFFPKPRKLLESARRLVALFTSYSGIFDEYPCSFDLRNPVESEFRARYRVLRVRPKRLALGAVCREVLDVIASKISEGKRVLVLTRSRKEASLLAYLLGIPPLYSELPQTFKLEVIEAVRKGEVRGVVAPKMSGIMLLDDVDTIIALPGSLDSRLFNRISTLPLEIIEITFGRRSRVLRKRFREPYMQR